MQRRSILLGSASLLAAPALLGRPAAAQGRTIQIGFQAPLSGEVSQYGIRFRHSGIMALEEFNRSGKLQGATVAIQYEDTQADPRQATTVAQKFADNAEMVGVLGDFSSSASMASAQIYARVGMPQLTPTASHPDYTKISKWQFRNQFTQAFEAPYEARWLMGMGLKKIAIITIQNDWGLSVNTNFTETVKKEGGEIVANELFNPGTREFRTILTKIARARPDALFMGTFYEDGAAVLQQKAQLGLRFPVFGGVPLSEPKLLELAGPAAEGLRMTTQFLPDDPDPRVSTFVREYTRRTNSEPNGFSALAYDAVNIMLAAIVKVGPSVTREQLRDALAETKNFPGVLGDITFDPVTREVSSELKKMEVKGGRFVLIQG